MLELIHQSTVSLTRNLYNSICVSQQKWDELAGEPHISSLCHRLYGHIYATITVCSPALHQLRQRLFSAIHTHYLTYIVYHHHYSNRQTRCIDKLIAIHWATALEKEKEKLTKAQDEKSFKINWWRKSVHTRDYHVYGVKATFIKPINIFHELASWPFEGSKVEQ